MNEICASFAILIGVIILFLLIILCKFLGIFIFKYLLTDEIESEKLNFLQGKILSYVSLFDNQVYIYYKDEDKKKSFSLDTPKFKDAYISTNSLFGMSDSRIYSISYIDEYILGRYIGTNIVFKTGYYDVTMKFK